MTDERKVTIAIPTYNRYQMTIDSFKKVIDDSRVGEICINDDCSTDDSCQRLVEYFKGNPKVKVFRNNANVDCYVNKAISAKKSSNEWVVVLDSDNSIDKSYLDAIFNIPVWDKQTMYIPEFASPYFSAKEWSGLTITSKNIGQYVNTNLMTNLNAFNLFINRDEYLRLWNGRVNPLTSDSLYVSYLWLDAGNKILVTPDMQYQHYISPNNDGHYQTHAHKNVEFHKILMQKIKQLR